MISLSNLQTGMLLRNSLRGHQCIIDVISISILQKCDTSFLNYKNAILWKSIDRVLFLRHVSLQTVHTVK